MSFEDNSESPQNLSPGAHESRAELSLLSLSLAKGLSSNPDLLKSQEIGFLRNVNNAAAVYCDLLPGVPAAIATQLKSDLSEHTGATIGTLAESAALGLGTAVLLARSPVLAKTLLFGAGLAGSTLMAGGTLRFTAEAFNADTQDAQSRLSEQARVSLGKLGANLIETTPAMMLGATSGYMLSSRVAALDTLAGNVRDTAELKMRRIVPEGFHYLSPDAKTLKLAGTANGEVNLYAAAEEMMQKTPWRGMEEGRFFKASTQNSLKISARLPGSEDQVMMGRRAEQVFHTHESSLLPSSGDFNTVYGTGVVAVPKRGILAFYKGTGKEAENVIKLLNSGKAEEAAQAAQALHSRTFESLLVDPRNKLAAGVELSWNHTANRLEPVSVRPLDFSETVNNLSKWKGQLNIEALKSSSEALLKPGMTDFLRKITANSGI